MELIVNISDEDYKGIKEVGFNGYPDQRNRIVNAISNGVVLSKNLVIIDKNKLKCDTEWDFYADCYSSYSEAAIEAAQVNLQAPEAQLEQMIAEIDGLEQALYQTPSEKSANIKRGQIIKQVILAKCQERETYGYTNLQSSDVTSILNELEQKGIELTRDELINLGLEESDNELGD